jgi:putative hemolysin
MRDGKCHSDVAESWLIPAITKREITHGNAIATGLFLSLSRTPLPATNRNTSRVLGRIGTLEVRLASTRSEIEAAQALRYRVFVEEMGARLPEEAMRRSATSTRSTAIATISWCSTRRLPATVEDQIVGTYRLLGRRLQRAMTGSTRKASTM